MSARSALAIAALLAASPADAYVRTRSSTTGVPLAWPVPIAPWQVNPSWADPAPSCRGGGALGAAQAAFSRWAQTGCANLQLPYAGESSEAGIGINSAGQSVVLFRNGWCSMDPRIVDRSTVPATILDPCFSDPDLTCGDKYGCFQDPVACKDQDPCVSWGLIALTTVLHDPATGRILAADVEVVGWDGAGAGNAIPAPPPHGWYFTCYPGTQPATLCSSYGQDACVYQDLQNTLTHEAGHFVGLAHPCRATGYSSDPSSLPLCTASVPAGEVPYAARTMAPTTSPGEISKRTLSADDVAGVCAVYPEASGGCGCGGGEATGAAALLGLAALARRGRRAQGEPDEARTGASGGIGGREDRGP